MTEITKREEESLGPTIDSALNSTKTITFSTIEEANQQIKQKFFVPSYLPESTVLAEVRIFYPQSDKVGTIELIYYHNNEMIIITQEHNNFSSALHFDNEDSLINGEPAMNSDGVFIQYKDALNKLIWVEEQFTFTIEANLVKDEIVKIAKSIK